MSEKSRLLSIINRGWEASFYYCSEHYIIGNDDDGWYLFIYSNNLLEKKYMFTNKESVITFLEKEISIDRITKISGDPNIAYSKAKLTMSNLIDELVNSNNELEFEFDGLWLSINNATDKMTGIWHCYFCYGTLPVYDNSVCQEYDCYEQLLKNANIDGKYLPELLVSINKTYGKLGKELFE